jgi:hypothetical protein
MDVGLSRWLAVALVVVAGSCLGRVAVARADGPACGTTPIGFDADPEDPEPADAIWCQGPLSPQVPTGRSDAFGGFTDNFDNSGALGSFNDNELGYRVFDNIDGGFSRHFVDNRYWIVDLARTSTFQGAAISPQQTFRFEHGRLVLEADVTAGNEGFAESNGADKTWPEVAWSTAGAPGDTTDALYLYGHFKGATSGGCRLQAHRSETCAVEADHVLSSTTGDQFPCFSAPPSRLFEISGHQQCGDVHSGMAVDFGAPSNAWRICRQGEVDPCLDRFRFEWTGNGLTLYVNGIEFGRDTGWPAQAQLPADIVDGSTPIHVYFGQWSDFSDGNPYRFHWQRIAVNPHDVAGNVLAPSQSPTFGGPPPPPPPPAEPVISGVDATATSATAGTVTWTTDEPASSEVDYGTTTAYGSSSPTDAALVTSHTVSLSGLQPATTYHYRVTSTDGGGNTARSADHTFTTQAPPPPPPGSLVGDEVIEPSVDENPPGMAEAFKYRASTGGTARTLSVYLDRGSAAGSVTVGLYSHNAGTNGPGTLLSQGTITAPHAGAWNTVSISPVGVSAGTVYWLAVLGPPSTGTVRFRDRATGGRNETSRQTNLVTLPATWTPGTIYANAPMSAFAGP